MDHGPARKRRKHRSKNREAWVSKQRAQQVQATPKPAVSPVLNLSHRPDPFHWPILVGPQAKKLEVMFQRQKANMSNPRNAGWFEFRMFNRMYRVPNAFTTEITKYADLFIYGMVECCNAVDRGMCWATIVEALVSPRTIMLPIVERCVTNDVPLICMADLRTITYGHYADVTSCVGIRQGCLREIRQEILNISNQYRAMQLQKKLTAPARELNQREKNERIIAELFDVNPINGQENDEKIEEPAREDVSKPSTSGVLAKVNRSCTITNSTLDKKRKDELLSSFKLVVRDPAVKSKKKAWLDLDEKKVVKKIVKKDKEKTEDKEMEKAVDEEVEKAGDKEVEKAGDKEVEKAEDKDVKKAVANVVENAAEVVKMDG